jgi:Lrp/AsnC family transcriptional regulator for asnA, asnC and gidA
MQKPTQKGGEAHVMSVAEHLDEIDLRILHHLQQDGRRSFREIAADVGVSERTVRMRVAQLRSRGVLQIMGLVNPAAVGFPIVAVIELGVDESALAECIGILQAMPAVRFIALTTGERQVLLEVVLRTHDELAKLLEEDFATLRGVRSTRVTLQLKVYKNQFSYLTDSV